MNHQESSVRSYLKTDFNRSLMNKSLFATSLKNWFVTGLATFVLVLASGLDAFAQTVTLMYTGATATTFTVPAGVTSVTVKVHGGAAGMGGSDGHGNSSAGPAGFINATYAVSPGQIIGIYPGGKGNNGANSATNSGGGAGGGGTYPSLNFNGGSGGNAGSSGSSGGGGGGGAASAVTINSSLVAVAGGAGGGGGSSNCSGCFTSGSGSTNSLTQYNGGNGASGTSCGSLDGGGGGGGGGGYFASAGGGTFPAALECAGFGGFVGTNYVTSATSVTSNTVVSWSSNGQVVIEYTAVAGTASASQTICSGNLASDLALTGFSGTIQWQVSTDNVNFSNISGATSATLTAAQMGVLSATRYYRAVVSGLVNSNTVMITVNPSPVISLTNSLCSANTLQWMTMNNISASSATGVGQNGITVAISQSGAGMLNVNGMYEATQFPAQYNVPTTGATIANQFSGNFQACFSQPVVNPVVAFSSIGNPSTCVPIIVSQPYSVVWTGQNMTYTSSTQMTGCEGKTIIRLDGTVTCVNFNYTASEYYSTIAFGFENQNCYSPTVCAGNSVTLNAAGASNYAWSPSGGLNTASGASVIATPTTTTTYTVSNPSDACAVPKSITVNVNPVPTVTVPVNITEMTGTTIPVQTFTSTVAGTTYAWTNNTPSIGLAATGSTSTPSFTATNNTASPVTATINVTPTAPNTCVGAAQAFTITVDPTPNVNQPANITNCEGTVTLVDFTGTTANTNYLWTNTNPSIGLASSGSNDLSFTTQNPTNVAQTASVTVTPQAYVTQGYVWGSVNENGSLTLSAPAGKVFTNVSFASYGTPSGSGGNYTLGACNAATSNSVISDLAIGNSTMTVVANNATFGDPCVTSSKALAVKLGYGVSVTGIPRTFSITVNPSATIANSTDTICTGTAFNFATALSDIVPANTTYSWTVANNTNIIGETAQATTSSSVSQTLFNSTSLDQIAVYTITPRSGVGACVGSPFTYNVTVTPLPTTISTTGSTTFCDGGSVTLIAPVAPLQMSYTYQWNLNGTQITGATSISYIANASGSYTVTVTNNAGCSATSQAVVVTENPLPTVAAITGTTTVCTGSTTTLSSLTAGGSWSSSNTATATVNAISGVVTGVSAGVATITYTVTNVNGCVNSQTAAVTVNALPTVAALTGASSICIGSATTFESATIGGVWSSSNAAVASVSALGVVTGVSAGQATITYTVTNGAGCVSSVSADINVTAVAIPTITASGVTTFCQGGSVTLTASSGSGNSYQWSNNTNDQILVVNTSGSYTVTVTNAAGCSATSLATTVTVNPLPATTAITGTSSVCIGGSTLLSTTATSPVWASANTAIATVAANGLVTGVSAGTTQVSYVITNANGCTNTSSVTVTVNQLPTAAIATVGATTFCQGGSVTLLASNAPAGMTYTYEWRLNGSAITGATANSFVANASGSYSVTITTNSGCAATSAATVVTVNALPILAANTGAVAVCENATTTIANAQVGGLWSTANNMVATINTITGQVTGVNPGTTALTYTFTNANGCTNTSVTNLTVNTLPSAIISASGATTFCQGASVILTASTGTSYLWSTGATTASITVNNTQDVTVTVTNANGCSATSASVSVTVNALPAVAIAPIGATTFCDGGSVTLISPLNSTYSYAWNAGSTAITGASNNTLIVSTSGNYTLTITDANGCTATSAAIPVTVNALPVVVATAGGPTTFCAGGSVTLTASGAANYVWNNGSTSQSITVNSSDVYSVVGTSIDGCSSISNAITVVVNALPTPSISSTGSTACLGTTINLTANGGATYSWSNGSTNATIAVTAANVYTVTATSAEGCTATASETVVFNANPSVTISANGPTVFCAGGSLTLTATGGSNYVWNNGTIGATVTVNQSGNYYVIVTNASGCTTQSALVNVTVNSVPVVAAITGSNTVCEGGNILLSSATIGGIWSIANNFIANIDGAGNVTGLNAGTTTVSYTVSTNGCTATTTAQLNVLNNPVAPTITASGATSVCPGSTVVLFASNGANYQWNTGATTPFVMASQSGTYTVTVTGINGCSATSLPVNVFIGDNTNPVIIAPLNVTVTPNLGCEAIGVTLGSPITSDNCAVATVSNDAPAIYPIGTTTVTWTVTDAAGNVATATQLVTVVDQTAPSAFAPANVTVASNSNCEAINVELGMPNATDNCTNNLVVSNNAPTTYPLGTTIVTWTISDAAGNTTTVDQTVTVVDQTAPVVLLANTSLILDANGNATIDFAALDNGSYDNCAIASTELSQSTFDCSQVGKNFITVYVTDNSGNQSSAVVMVTVVASDACGGDSWNGPSVPDAFTPNGNNYNDTWVIPGLEGYNTKEMTVYSRYGSLVHYSSVYNNDWDGTLLNTGTPVPDGTYYYILKLDGGKQLNGYVYINRVKQ